MFSRSHDVSWNTSRYPIQGGRASKPALLHIENLPSASLAIPQGQAWAFSMAAARGRLEPFYGARGLPATPSSIPGGVGRTNEVERTSPEQPHGNEYAESECQPRCVFKPRGCIETGGLGPASTIRSRDRHDWGCRSLSTPACSEQVHANCTRDGCKQEGVAFHGNKGTSGSTRLHSGGTRKPGSRCQPANSKATMPRVNLARINLRIKSSRWETLDSLQPTVFPISRMVMAS